MNDDAQKPGDAKPRWHGRVDWPPDTPEDPWPRTAQAIPLELGCLIMGFRRGSGDEPIKLLPIVPVTLEEYVADYHARQAARRAAAADARADAAGPDAAPAAVDPPKPSD